MDVERGPAVTCADQAACLDVIFDGSQCEQDYADVDEVEDLQQGDGDSSSTTSTDGQQGSSSSRRRRLQTTSSRDDGPYQQEVYTYCKVCLAWSNARGGCGKNTRDTLSHVCSADRFMAVVPGAGQAPVVGSTNKLNNWESGDQSE